MHLNILMTRQMVIEKYGISPELEAEIFAMLTPVMGSGANAQYLESRVDQQLDKYFANKERPALAAVKSYYKEKNMAQTWADTVAEPEEPSHVIQLPPLLVDEKTAAELLGVSKRTVFELNEAGELPCKRIGSRKLYSVTRLREYAEKGAN